MLIRSFWSLLFLLISIPVIAGGSLGNSTTTGGVNVKGGEFSGRASDGRIVVTDLKAGYNGGVTRSGAKVIWPNYYHPAYFSSHSYYKPNFTCNISSGACSPPYSGKPEDGTHFSKAILTPAGVQVSTSQCIRDDEYKCTLYDSYHYIDPWIK